MTTVHNPVMLNEAVEHLNLHKGDNIIDGTFGGGGHSQKILEKISPNGKLLAIDANSDVISWAQVSQPELAKNKNFKLVIDNFKNLEKVVEENFDNPIHGILLDLGLSSDELEQSNRGFSFQKDEPLDMRFDKNQRLTAEEIINKYSKEKLYDIFKTFGEYAHANRLSEIILEQRRIKEIQTTKELVDLILLIHHRNRKEKIHPATKVFQALRIAVNSELDSLISVLPQAISLLELKGRLVIISFHSSEDRIVKHFFRNEAKLENPKIKIITKRPLVPTEKEILENPRSRSAKMRVVEKI